MTDEKGEYVYIDADGALGGTPRSSPKKPSLVAQEFLAEWAGERLVWRGNFYKHAGSHWELEDDTDVMAEVNRELMGSVYREWDKETKKEVTLYWNPTNSSLDNLSRQLKLQASLPSNVEPVRGGEFIFLKNGRYSFETGVLLPHDSAIFNLHASPFAYDPQNPEPCPMWDQFLKETFEGDQDSIDTHYLWMAYELLGATDLQKAYYLLGAPRSGKGTLMTIGDALLGAPQVTAMSLKDFAGDFGMQSLLAKSVCRVNDVRDPGRAGPTATERLLGIIGGDPVQIRRMYQDPWVGHLGVRFTFASNEILRLLDSSGAINTRFILNRTGPSHLGHEDYGLAQRIIDGEMPGILHRVLPYVDRIREPWPENKRAGSARESMKEASQPLLEFVEECGILFGEGLSVGRAELYSVYKSWAELNGMRPMISGKFGIALRAGFTCIKDFAPRVDGRQVRRYEGIALPPVVEEKSVFDVFDE